MKKFLVLFFTIFYVNVNSSSASENKKYMLVEFLSPSMGEAGYPDNELTAGKIYVDNKNKPKLYLAEECKREIYLQLEDDRKLYNIKYYGNGVYYNGGFSRFVCLEHDIANKYINIGKYFTFFDLVDANFEEGSEKAVISPSQFSKDFPDVVPYILKEEDIKNYTIFPLMKNQKEAKKLTNKLNEEVNNVLQQLLKK